MFGFGNCPRLGCGSRMEVNDLAVRFLVCIFEFTVCVEDCETKKIINTFFLLNS